MTLTGARDDSAFVDAQDSEPMHSGWHGAEKWLDKPRG
jgi:hypothetical protein